MPDFTITLTDEQAAGLTYVVNKLKVRTPSLTEQKHLQATVNEQADRWAQMATGAADRDLLAKLKAAPKDVFDAVSAVVVAAPIVVK